jgi:hypothetical protein
MIMKVLNAKIWGITGVEAQNFSLDDDLEAQDVIAAARGESNFEIPLLKPHGDSVDTFKVSIVAARAVFVVDIIPFDEAVNDSLISRIWDVVYDEDGEG